jgi:spore germination protein GerM
VSVYLEGSRGLVPVTRHVRGEVDARSALDALLEGPSGAETRLGLSSAIPSRDAVRLVTDEDGTATVELSSDFRDGTVTHQVAALAQIVYTLTGVPGVEEVRFEIDGALAAVPRHDGSLTREPVNRSDYDELVVREAR